jgi:hypothetical protein
VGSLEMSHSIVPDLAVQKALVRLDMAVGELPGRMIAAEVA